MSKGWFELPMNPSAGRKYKVTISERDELIRKYELDGVRLLDVMHSLEIDLGLVPESAPKTANKMKKLIAERIESSNAASVRAR